MKRFPPLGLAPLLLGAVLAPPSLAAGLLDGYAEPGSVAAELRTLAGRLPGGTIVEYGHSPDGRPLLALQVSRGSGDPNMRPALLIIGGVEPERLATVELALAIAGRAGAVPDSGSDPLATSVLYVIADPAPDGRARVLAGGGGWIGAPVDDDADGRLDEDGPEDLDGDGLVRWMRVWRNGGAYRPDTADVRASIKADAAAGQVSTDELLVAGDDLGAGDPDTHRRGTAGHHVGVRHQRLRPDRRWRVVAATRHDRERDRDREGALHTRSIRRGGQTVIRHARTRCVVPTAH